MNNICQRKYGSKSTQWKHEQWLILVYGIECTQWKHEQYMHKENMGLKDPVKTWTMVHTCLWDLKYPVKTWTYMHIENMGLKVPSENMNTIYMNKENNGCQGTIRSLVWIQLKGFKCYIVAINVYQIILLCVDGIWWSERGE